MSRLSNLLRQVETQDPQLAADLKREVEALSGRRAFGLNFERHIPETVELQNRPVRREDKVRFLPERGEKPSSADNRPWRVDRIRRTRSISYATTGSWPHGPATATASCPPNRLKSRQRRTANRALRPAAIACGGATLLARVFSSDISECTACGGRLRIIAALTDPASIRTYLEGVGLPPRAPPQPQFEFAA